MTREQNSSVRHQPSPSLSQTCSTVRSERVGNYNLLVVEHFHADGSGIACFSVTRCRVHEDGSHGRLVSYGSAGFCDFDSAREFGIAWCRESAELQSV